MIDRRLAAAGALALSAAGAAMISGFEGTSLSAYLDPVGIPTICTGSTEGVRLGQRATFEECNARLKRDTGAAGQDVARCTRVAVTQTQYDALVSLVFNIGGAAYCGSTLARKLNAGDCWGAGYEFSRWTYSAGRRLPGLINRRAAERAAFETGCERASS